MFRYLILVFLYFFNIINASSQNQNTAFKLIGNINIDTGTIKLLSIGEDVYYPPMTYYHEAKVTNGEFTFNDSIKYPTAYRLRITLDSTREYMSDIFFVDPGTQFIKCNVDSVWEVPGILNKSMSEYNGYLNAFDDINIEFSRLSIKQDSLFKTYAGNTPDSSLLVISKIKSQILKRESIVLLDYLKRNTDSYVALWMLVNKLSSGYEIIYDSIYNKFSDLLRNTYTGIAIGKKLKSARSAAVGNFFPRLPLLNVNNQRRYLSLINTSYKYTLIDFWFSHCNPCISQFEELKKILANSNSFEFNIIGISTDVERFISNWKNIINQHKLTWMQYLDVNGVETKKMAIDKFPTNFLIDSKGRIIAKDIELSELRLILKQSK